MKNRILIVSNRLPINISGLPGKLQLQRSNGGVATALSSVINDYDALWFGWTGTSTPISRLELRALGGDKRLRPVHIPARLLHRYYDAFSNGVLWPMLHGFKPTIKHDAADWEAYKAVNAKFAKALQATAKPEDIIWIQDYHLMLLPQMLRELGMHNRIGFFLHSPFARTDCLAALPEQRELLSSLAQVDVMGLHTPRDTTHFTASLKELGITLRPDTVVKEFPIGVDHKAYQGAEKLPKVRRFMNKALKKIDGKYILLSVSRLDYTKGIPQQLLAYEKLLAKQVEPEKFLYKLIVAPSREDAAGYKELKAEIERLVKRINSRFGNKTSQPIDYTYRNCGFEEVSTWYLLADILLVTPKIDGMNLVIKEFIATRSDNHSMLVISNTIGAAFQLTEALQVDPLDVTAIAATLQEALDMPPEERAPRWQALRKDVRDHNVFWWVREILDALEASPQTVLTSEMLHRPKLHLHPRLRAPRLLRLTSSKTA